MNRINTNVLYKVMHGDCQNVEDCSDCALYGMFCNHLTDLEKVDYAKKLIIARLNKDQEEIDRLLREIPWEL